VVYGKSPRFVPILVFWGIGVVAHGASVFVGTGTTDRMAGREYEKLKKAENKVGQICVKLVLRGRGNDERYKEN
jgi:hypothetical protein